MDLLRSPVLGRFLRWRHARTVLQVILVGAAGAIVVDGFLGPAEPSRNAAGTLPWVQWRGLVVIALLTLGNVFCMACPFMLPRRLAKRLWAPSRPVPRWLKGKWVAIGGLIAFFWAYEALDLWASPFWTAWVVIGYFVVAFSVDALFRGAAFCKHVCPIGQFHFVHAPLSPFEVAIRSPDPCVACKTKDCIRGRWPTEQVKSREGLPLQRGCELWLFQQRKVGNADCTFCMECIHACPHDNVGIMARRPGLELTSDPVRSGVGRLSERTDLAILAVVMTFASLVNALGMIGPFVTMQSGISRALGVPPELVLAGLMVVALMGVPALLLAGAGGAERRLAATPRSAWRRYVWGLVPLGLSMWGAHHFYHFALGASTLLPLGQRIAGLAGLGASAPSGVVVTTPEFAWMLPAQVSMLALGTLASLRLLTGIGRDAHEGAGSARATLPWKGLAWLLFVMSCWLLTQPMEMRGLIGG